VPLAVKALVMVGGGGGAEDGKNAAIKPKAVLDVEEVMDACTEPDAVVTPHSATSFVAFCPELIV
jgi:hypothetical protein